MDATPSDVARRQALTDAVLDLFTQFCAAAFAAQSDDWLSVELTLPQLRAVVQTVTLGRATGSRLAKALGIGLPSATRLVDRLAEHGLVRRDEDPADRRVTDIVPTEAAVRLVERMQTYRQEFLGALLASLDLDQLAAVERGLSHLALASQRAAASLPDLDETPAAAGAAGLGAQRDG